MSRVAIATCRGDNVDVDSPVLLDAFRRAGVEARECVWDDPAVDWESFDLTVVRSTWDYAPRRDEFLAWARQRPRLANDYQTLAYSTDKHYLVDLAARGLPVVPSTFVEVGETPVFPAGTFVVKPAVGAGSIDAEFYRPGHEAAARAHVAALHQRGRSVLLQPYVPTVDIFGEHALIYIDGVFSHAMAKGPMLRTPADERDVLFRREQMSLDVADPDALVVAAATLADFDHPLYARVDLVAAPSGWQILELELAEPSLFLTFAPAAADALVAAVRRRLA